ncbi:sodium:proton antiporter [Helicobacter pylori]|nr:sodium:proton antiporter [Helicobacter pylori]
MHAVKLSLAWHKDACSFKQALKRFLKLNQRSIKTKPNPPHRLVLGV